LRSVKISADGPSSLSVGFGVKLPILVPFNQSRAQRPRVRLMRKVGLCACPPPSLQSLVPFPAPTLTITQKLSSGGKLIIAEIDCKPWWKFVLTQLADHMLYPGQGIYYRFPESMAELLKKFPVKVETEVMHQNTPFSHITYICAKP
jgi:hypothetical protein